MSDPTIAILIALIAGPMGALLASWLNSSKNKADINRLITESARELISEYKEQADTLQKKVKVLEAEFEAQASAIENLTGTVMKYQLGLAITVMQLRLAGFEPMIDPAKLETMSIDELRLVAEGLRNAERRREARHDDSG